MNMRKKILFTIVAVILAGSAYAEEINVSTQAQGTINLRPPLPPETQMRDAENRQEFKSEVKVRAGEIKTRMSNRVNAQRMEMLKRVKHEFEMMTKRMRAAIERLEKLISRINSRVEKVKSQGGDTTSAEGKVTAAKAKIDEAKSNLETLKTRATDLSLSIETSTSTATSTRYAEFKSKFGELRALSETIKKNLKDAHKLLVEAVTTLKGLRVSVETEVEVHSTTTTP